MANSSVVTIPIRFTDLDVLGHVNNAKYLTYCEEFRMLTLQALDACTPQGPSWLGSSVIARAQVEYRKPIDGDQGHVGVTGEILKVGKSSVEMRNRIYAGGQICAEVDVTLVHIDGNGRASAMSDAQRSWWLRFISTEASPQRMCLGIASPADVTEGHRT